MKKFLFFAFGLGLVVNSSAQEEVYSHSLPERFSELEMMKKSTMAVEDTLQPTITCTPTVSYLPNANGSIITGTYSLQSGVISEIGQILNTSHDVLEVHSILAVTLYKEEGPNKGSFTAAVYDTTGGISASPLGVTDPVAFDDINDTSSSSLITRFPFANPVTVTSAFWAALEVDNGSDTLSVASTGNGCGQNAIMRTSQGWTTYSSVFTSNGNPVQIAIHLWAEVESTTVGLDKSFISKSGLDFYPNPARDQATIKYEMAGERELTLLVQDMTGRTVYSNTHLVTADSEIQLDLSSFEQGAYTYQLVGKKQQLNGVFVKE